MVMRYSSFFMECLPRMHREGSQQSVKEEEAGRERRTRNALDKMPVIILPLLLALLRTVIVVSVIRRGLRLTRDGRRSRRILCGELSLLAFAFVDEGGWDGLGGDGSSVGPDIAVVSGEEMEAGEEVVGAPEMWVGTRQICGKRDRR